MIILKKSKLFMSLIFACTFAAVSPCLPGHRVNAQNSAGIYGDQKRAEFLVNDGGVLTKYNGFHSEVKIPDNVKVIDMKVFSDHPEIERVILPEGLVSVGDYAFSDCVCLSSIELPDSTESIGNLVFSNCIGLKKVSIGKNINRIGELAFWGCEMLESVDISEDNQSFSSRSGIMFSKDMKVLIYCPAGIEGSYTVPDGVERLSEYAFFGCKKITEIVLPDSVKELGDTCMYGCSDLKNIKFGNGIEQIGACTFADCIGLKFIDFPKSIKVIGSNAFFNCLSLHEVTVRSEKVSFGYRVFGSCKNVILNGYEGSGTKQYADKSGLIFCQLEA